MAAPGAPRLLIFVVDITTWLVVMKLAGRLIGFGSW
jgi:hypothetical protein